MARNIDLKLQSAPSVNHGVSTGYGDWKFSVQLQINANGLQATYGAWVDITDDVRGVSFVRGADEPWGRPRVGEMRVTLSSRDRRWSPVDSDASYSPGQLGPGAVMRCGVRSATDTVLIDGWIPLFSGIVDSWTPVYADNTVADETAEVTVTETLSYLAGIDENAIASVGAGDYADYRISGRLLPKADWPFGFIERPSGNTYYTMQATEMADNRLAECYRTADSAANFVTFRSDTTGAALLFDWQEIDTDTVLRRLSADGSRRGTLGLDWYAHTTSIGGSDPNMANKLYYVPYHPASIDVGNDKGALYNDVRLSKVTGSQQVAEQNNSIDRWGRRTYVRNDLMNNTNTNVQYMANILAANWGTKLLRMNAATVTASSLSEPQFLACIACDVHSYMEFLPPDKRTGTGTTRGRIEGPVASLRHNITPKGHGLMWEVTYGLESYGIYNIEGAVEGD